MPVFLAAPLRFTTCFLLVLASLACDEPKAAIERPRPTSTRSRGAPPTQSPELPAAPAGVAVALATTRTVTDYSGRKAGALGETRARIETLTAVAAGMVRAVEARPPDRLMLVRLDAAFIDARRMLTTDKQLAVLGERLTPAEQAAARAYSKAVYERLKVRVAAAGKRHRAAAAAQDKKKVEVRP